MNKEPYSTEDILRRNVAAPEVALRTQTERAEKAELDFESLISDDNTIQEYAYELGGTDSGEHHLTAQDVARIAAKASEPYTSALRSLASYVGAGGYNADTVDAGVFEEKIRWGIGEIMARMEKAEAELEKLVQQKPVAWMHDKDGRVDTCHDSVKKLWIKVGQKHNTPFMRELVPCRVEHYNIPLYAAPVPAPAVLEEWRDVMQDAHDTFQRYADQHRAKDTRDSHEKANVNQKLANRLYALLQSAEVQAGDKWQLTPAPTHPADRNAGEVRHD